MPYLLRLKIILQSKKFIILSLLFISIYVLIMTKGITYESKLEDNATKITGNIISYTIDGNKLSMLIKTKEKIKVTYYINTLEEKEYLQENLLLGSKINLEGTLNEPYNNTIPNTFNYKEYLYYNKIYKTFTANKVYLTDKTSFLNQIKTDFMHKIEKMGSSSAYLYALILGEVDYIGNDVYKEYQANGTTHLFAVSGMHISALALFLSMIFRKIKLKEWLGNIIIVLFLLFYMFLVGFTPSVLRGGLLFIFLLLNRKSKLNLKTINVLYLLFLLLVFINPFNIYSLGFIYSFLTSFGLILFSKKITGNYFIKLIKTSTIAFLFSFPVTIYHFYEINLLTILNNIIVVPIVTIILFPLTLATFIMPILEPLLVIGIECLEWISHILHLFSFNLVVPKINFVFIVIYYLFVYFIYKYHVKYVFFIILLVISYKLFPYLDSSSYIYFLDVGQGDCTVVIGNNLSYIVMIDTGGKITYETEEWEKKNKTYNISDNVITFLKSKGITKIDYLIGTHGDFDHMGETINLLENFKIKQVILNNDEYNDLELKIIEVLKQKKIKYSQNIQELRLNDNQLYFLNHKLYDNENDNSLVLYLNLKGVKLLLMGDAGVEVEKELLEKYNLKNVDILKVGHHGSKTSSSKEFIEKIKPTYSIISVGRNNRYGHPNIDTLKKLEQSLVYRTDLNGSIVFKIKNNLLKIENFQP